MSKRSGCVMLRGVVSRAIITALRKMVIMIDQLKIEVCIISDEDGGREGDKGEEGRMSI